MCGEVRRGQNDRRTSAPKEGEVDKARERLESSSENGLMTASSDISRSGAREAGGGIDCCSAAQSTEMNSSWFFLTNRTIAKIK